MKQCGCAFHKNNWDEGGHSAIPGKIWFINMIQRLRLVNALGLVASACFIAQSASSAELAVEPRVNTVFPDGFHRGSRTLTIAAGGHYGLATLGSFLEHHMALVSASYGYMLEPVLQDSVLRGNCEIRGELFGGWQFSPEDEWLVGLTPHLRYNFDTRSRWIPFFDMGAGVTATTIQRPDLSGYFQFNLQVGAGTHYLLSPSLALTAEARFLHLSCAGINLPNRGVNGVAGLLGVTWLY